MCESTPERYGKQVENFCYMPLWGVTRMDRCFQNTSAPRLIRHAPSIGPISLPGNLRLGPAPGKQSQCRRAPGRRGIVRVEVVFFAVPA
jgi:hypothetical protein